MSGSGAATEFLWLLHQVLVHPFTGLLDFVAAVLGWTGLEQFSLRIHRALAPEDHSLAPKGKSRDAGHAPWESDI